MCFSWGRVVSPYPAAFAVGNRVNTDVEEKIGFEKFLKFIRNKFSKKCFFCLFVPIFPKSR